MRCPFCGFENPDSSNYCNSCGKELRAQMGFRRTDRRSCVSCGRTIPDEANVCPYCGHDYRYQMTRPVAAISSGMRILFYVLSLLVPIAGFIIGAIYLSKGDPESKHVGKMCLILAVVGILLVVGLSAALYVLILGFGGGPIDNVPLTALSKSSVTDGTKFTFLSITRPTPWSEVTLMLSDGSDFADWGPSTGLLDSGAYGEVEHFAPASLGALTVFCNLTDLMGNGYIDSGDYFTLTTDSANPFSSAVTYTVTIVYEPSGSQICNIYFTG